MQTLIRKASLKADVPVLQFIYDAFCWEQIYVSKRRLWNVYQVFIHTNYAPQFIEDYALEVLAGHAVRLETNQDIINMMRRR